AAADAAAVDELVAELVDRFGELPQSAQNLLRSARLRIAARRLGVRRLDFGAHGGYLQFEAENSLDPRAVIQLVQARQSPYRLEGPLKLRVSMDLEDEAERFEFVAGLLRRLAPAAPGRPMPAATR
ncbi:MAG: hypothetical protein MUF07_17820, partial [Steroidobacteraceae bacterium]|nr:hypothetical protein [Steroidobacteraceae bacterium]